MSQIVRTIIFASVQFFANFVQTVTGFGGGPISMPPSMAVVGVNDAKAAVTAILWLTCIVVSVREVKSIDIKQLGIILAGMVPGVFVGMWLFMDLPLKILMFIYGIIVVMIAAKRLLIPAKSDLAVPIRITALILAGLMQGMFTSGGPFLVVYAVSAISEKSRFRATISTVWAVINTYMVGRMICLGMYKGNATVLVGASVIPVILAILIGKKVSDRLDHEQFLRFVYILLMVSGVLLIYNYFIQ